MAVSQKSNILSMTGQEGDENMPGLSQEQKAQISTYFENIYGDPMSGGGAILCDADFRKNFNLIGQL